MLPYVGHLGSPFYRTDWVQELQDVVIVSTGLEFLSLWTSVR